MLNYDNLTLNERLYYNKLPDHPRCTNSFAEPVIIRAKPVEYATEKRYIQHNPPFRVNTIAVDVDDLDEPEDKEWASMGLYGVLKATKIASDVNLPPQVVIKNRHNAKGHMLFYLKTPVHLGEFAREKPLKLLAEAEKRLTVFVGGDITYNGELSKNPLHKDFEVFYINKSAYELNDFLKLPRVLKSTEELRELGCGRNVTVFETVRKVAYKLWASGKFNKNNFQEVVMFECESVNLTFNNKLGYNELKGIAKSIAKYCINNITPEKRHRYIAERCRYNRQKVKDRNDKLIDDELLRLGLL